MGRKSAYNSGNEYAPENNPDYDRSLAAYLRDISKSEPLSSKEEIELGKRIKEGDIEARNKLVFANSRFVVSIAKEYWNERRSLNELISAGNFGLMVAADRFDETKGFRFISYAVWWVRQAILQYLGVYERTVRLPLNRIDMLSKLNHFTEDHMKEDGKMPGLEDIAEKFNISVFDVSQLLGERRYPLSLDAIDEGGERSLYERLPDKNQQQPDDVYSVNALGNEVKNSLNSLSEREAEVLRCYFGLDGYPEMTLEEIGDRFGRTRERIRQIKEKGLNKLRHPRRGARLHAYWNDVLS